MTAHGAFSPLHAAERFAAHAAGLKASALPPDATAAVRAFTLDTIGVGLAGGNSRYAAGVLAAARRWGEGNEASVWMRGARLPAPQAAFVNAFLVHCQEYDCVHEKAVLHPFTVIVPVLLAEAEGRTVGGADFVAACAAGVDVAAGLGVAATSQIRFFRPATCGLFGAIAALARVRHLDQATTRHALGYGLAFASGTMQAHVEGTPALAAQVAGGARSAFQAVDLAEAGLPGPAGAIDGRFGYLTLFEESTDLSPVLDALGATWRVNEVSWKPHPTGRAAHGGVAMMQAALKDGVRADDIDRISFSVPPLIMHLVGRPIVSPIEVNYARLCLPYAAATALRFGGVDLRHFAEAALADPETHALAARIAVTEAANSDAAAFTPQKADVVLRSGATHTYTLDQLPGSPARPLSREAQLAKFRGCVAFATGDASDDAGHAIVSLVDALDTLPSVATLSRAIGKAAA